jgi:hypothetical protein
MTPVQIAEAGAAAMVTASRGLTAAVSGRHDCHA